MLYYTKRTGEVDTICSRLLQHIFMLNLGANLYTRHSARTTLKCLHFPKCYLSPSPPRWKCVTENIFYLCNIFWSTTSDSSRQGILVLIPVTREQSKVVSLLMSLKSTLWSWHCAAVGCVHVSARPSYINPSCTELAGCIASSQCNVSCELHLRFRNWDAITDAQGNMKSLCSVTNRNTLFVTLSFALMLYGTFGLLRSMYTNGSL